MAHAQWLIGLYTSDYLSSTKRIMHKECVFVYLGIHSYWINGHRGHFTVCGRVKLRPKKTQMWSLMHLDLASISLLCISTISGKVQQYRFQPKFWTPQIILVSETIHMLAYGKVSINLKNF